MHRSEQFPNFESRAAAANPHGWKNILSLVSKGLAFVLLTPNYPLARNLLYQQQSIIFLEGISKSVWQDRSAYPGRRRRPGKAVLRRFCNALLVIFVAPAHFATVDLISRSATNSNVVPHEYERDSVFEETTENIRVLIVDAQPGDYLPILTSGRQPATHWQVYRTGTDALQSANAEGAHLCLINTRLPDMLGLELYGLLKSRLRVIPVVFVADRYRRDDELSVLQTGTLHFVCKPLEPSFLERILDTQPSNSGELEPKGAK